MGVGRRGFWPAIRSLGASQVQLSLGGELLHAGAISVPRIMGRHVSRRLQLLDAIIARFVSGGYRMGGTIQ